MTLIDDAVGNVQGYVLLALVLVSLGVKGFAVIDALRRPAAGFISAGKRTKPLWLAIVGFSLAIDVVLLYSPLAFLNIAGFVASSVYLVDVRPALIQVGGGPRGGRSSGRSGGW